MFKSIRVNKARTFFIVLLVCAFVYGVVFFAGHMMGMGVEAFILAFIFMFFSCFFSYFYSDKIILRLMRARPADETTDRLVKNAMQGLIIASGMPMPRVYIIEEDSLNAFATGRNPNNAVVAVTRGLVKHLDYYQLEAVLAHELAHIRNYDILLSTVVTVMVGAAVMLCQWVTRMAFWGGGRGGDRNSGKAGAILMIVGLVFMVLAPIFGQLLKMSLSRNREYLADATAIEFTRNPEGLAGALEKIAGNSEISRADTATASMFIACPVSNLKGKERRCLFATHPPIQSRIDAIRNITA